jgi:hypothetical protein
MQPPVRVAHARGDDPSQIADQLVESLGSPCPSVVLFFCSSQLPFEAVAERMQAAFGDVLTVGSTTCGEIGPEGCTTGGVSAIALAEPVRAVAQVIERAAEFRFADGAPLMGALLEGLGETPASLAQRPGDFVLITLSDGLAGGEEVLLASIHDAAPGVGLVGGSSADDFQFKSTATALRGRSYPGGSVVLLLEPGVPFHPFHLHHFSRGEDAIYITGAQPLERLVSRIDGYPAVPWLARRMGFDEAALRQRPGEVLNQTPVVFGTRSGNATFMRSVMNVQGDALLMGGAIEEGAIVYLMEGADLIDATRNGIEAAISVVPNPAGTLLFNCGGRMWEATVRDEVDALGEAMGQLPCAGFTTYGEQFGTMQINHTLTGLVFGSADV